MPSNTLISGLPYANGPDQPSIPFHTNNLAQKLDPLVIPSFGSAQLRDSVITAAILAKAPNGGEGLHCYIVNSGMWEYDGAAWVPMGPRIAATKVYAGTPTVTSTSAGPAGVPNINTATFASNRKRLYRSNITGVLQGDTVGAQFRLYVTDELGNRIDIRDEITVAGSPGQKYFSYTSADYVLPVGTHTIGCTFTLIIGGGTLGLNSMTLTVTDLGPA